MYRFARGRGLSPPDAEEVRDQCLEIVALKIADFNYVRARGGLKNCLRLIVTRRVIDLLRKRRELTAESDEIRALRSREESPDGAWEYPSHKPRGENLRGWYVACQGLGSVDFAVCFPAGG